MRRVVIVGPPPVQVLDVTGPLEVFSSGPEYKVVLAAPGTAMSLATHRGIDLGPATPLADVSLPIDTLVVAGGPGAEASTPNVELVDWLKSTAPRCRRIAAVCTGAFALAEAGLLDNRNAVTHWAFCERLAHQYPSVRVNPDPIFLRDGQVYTSAGITAGIDLALALVEEDHGHGAALDIARQLVMFLVRPGGQAQFSHMLTTQRIASKQLRELQVWVQDNLRADLTLPALALRMGVSDRHLARLCHKDLLTTPAQLVEQIRVATAQQLIDSSDAGLKEIADRCGFSSAEMMRRAFVRRLGISAVEYSNRFRRRGT